MTIPDGCFDYEATADIEDDAQCTPQPSKVYLTLKQYTTMNDYKDASDVEKMSYFSWEYLFHKLGLRSENDIIDMKEYGTYTGGTGRDTFVIHPNYTGQDEGRHLIIKDFNEEEDLIDLSHFESVAFDDLDVSRTRTMGKESTLVSTRHKGNGPVFILYGCDPDSPLIEQSFRFAPKLEETADD